MDQVWLTFRISILVYGNCAYSCSSTKLQKFKPLLVQPYLFLAQQPGTILGNFLPYKSSRKTSSSNLCSSSLNPLSPVAAEHKPTSFCTQQTPRLWRVCPWQTPDSLFKLSYPHPSGLEGTSSLEDRREEEPPPQHFISTGPTTLFQKSLQMVALTLKQKLERVMRKVTNLVGPVFFFKAIPALITYLLVLEDICIFYDVTNCHKLRGFKQHKFTVSLFFKSEV